MPTFNLQSRLLTGDTSRHHAAARRLQQRQDRRHQPHRGRSTTP
ncbi:MAG: hypothetical protein WKG07_03760 [Hymenobacter sp.]